jgi:hypothetical protein
MYYAGIVGFVTIGPPLGTALFVYGCFRAKAAEAIGHSRAIVTFLILPVKSGFPL